MKVTGMTHAGEFRRGFSAVRILCLAALVFCLTPALSGFAGDTLSWQAKKNLVTADIRSGKLSNLLEQIATLTGWKVYVEPELTHTVSAKFENLPPGEALRLLLGDLNFALVPETNANSKLFVFHTEMKNATEQVRGKFKSRLLANELIIRLKPGQKIEDVAKMLGAKVIGRIASLNAYRLQFDDEAAAQGARAQLAANPDIASVDSNYGIDRPSLPSGLPAGGVPPPPQLQLKPPADNGRIVIGLVDTAVQPLGNNLDQFLLKQLSVAGESVTDPNSPSHGTSMAETMLRSLQAMTKGSTSVQILPVDVYGPNASTSTFDVANGIVQAVNGGAKIINLSLGSPDDSPFLRDVVQAVSKQNIPIFAAAGNDGTTAAFYPAAYPEVAAVTAVDQGQIPAYANRGSYVSLGAPGTSIIYYNSQPWYVVGTSASSAFTSGIAAGYMDSTRNGVDKMQSFLKSTFGLNNNAAGAGNPGQTP